jgi:hypothetical protein
MMQKKGLLKLVAAALLLVVLAAGMLVVYQQFGPQSKKDSSGNKEIVVEVVIPDEDSEEYTMRTDAEFLRQALDEIKLIQGTDSEYGFYITTVNQRTADDANSEWWCITKDNEQVNYGVDQIAISDGDHYEITLTVGY